MKGLMLYDNEMKSEKIIHILARKHGVTKIDKYSIDESIMINQLSEQYDYVIFILDTAKADKFDYDIFARLFSELEETITIHITPQKDNSFWNDKFDHQFMEYEYRELAKLLFMIRRDELKSNWLPSWAQNRLIIQSKKNHHFIKYEDIVFIEKDQKLLKLYTKDDLIETRENLSNIEAKLPENFIQVHRAYVINLDYVSKIENIGNRSYQVKFNDIDDIAYMSRYQADKVFSILNCG